MISGRSAESIGFGTKIDNDVWESVERRFAKMPKRLKGKVKNDFKKIVMFRRGYPDEPELAYFNKDASYPEDEYCNFWIRTKYGNYPLKKQESIITILRDKAPKEKSYIPPFKQFAKVFHDLRQGIIKPYV